MTHFAVRNASTTNLIDLTVTDAAARIRAGSLPPTALLEAILARIDAVEPALHAWVAIDRAGALARARELTEQARRGDVRGPLHGIPVGIKDIIHVAGMVTTTGAGDFAHERPTRDAVSVARLRRAGAIILGKTTTTEFAYLDPTDTRNPWNLEHTPGGSSAGSAAAVGARMIPLALGSQTIGSTLRPAAYCGIVGFKPSHGGIDLDGVHPLAPSLDHVGIFCRSVDDARLAFTVLSKDPVAEAGIPKAPGAQRIGLIDGAFSARADAETRTNLAAVAAALARAGSQVAEVELPPSYLDVTDAMTLILEVEAARVHEAKFAVHGAHYRPKIQSLLERGRRRGEREYARALELRRQFQTDMRPLPGTVDVLMMPTTPAPAPRGLDSTGDPSFCAPWSFAGMPAISVPSGLSRDGLPLAVQLIAEAGAESKLLAVARWVEQVIGFDAAPALNLT